MKQMTVKELTCLKCGYKWMPRKTGRPAECPECKRRDWDKPMGKR